MIYQFGLVDLLEYKIRPLLGDFKAKLHNFDLLWICWIEEMEFGFKLHRMYTQTRFYGGIGG